MDLLPLGGTTDKNVRSGAPREAFPENLASTGCGTHSSLLIDRISTIADAGEGRRGRVEVGGFQVEPGFPRSSYGSFAGPGMPIGGRGAAIILDPETLALALGLYGLKQQIWIFR